MNSKAYLAIFMVILGCMLNNVFLEYIIKLDPGSGHLITALQFLFIALHGLIFTSKFGTVKPKVPFKEYLKLVAFFFATSVINNWAFAFHIPVPLHFIFRAGSLIANMLMGILILKRKYTIEKYLSVFMITTGIVICTLYSSKEVGKCTDCDNVSGNQESIGSSEENEVDASKIFWWVIGIVLLTGALLLSARMGIYQETLYKKFGKHPEEALFYTHLYSLPGFFLYSSSIMEHIAVASSSEPIQIPFTSLVLPLIWIYLLLNVVTQYMCISSVYVLTTECTSLTVTLVLTLRKFLSLVFSIVYFQNPFTIAHWFGTILVFGGTLLFAEVPHRMMASLRTKPKTDKKTN
ncbi:UDP-xylose and UDP-N-acetylglucosamine transporter [Anthonomus grandis grandis]|uniref:UDP-xylose and UDP-N-acetylglucosamine transporter n=1 Tax=Anthonomus grandis grandis TaxID=2921223 RepID=UPI002166A712|nr:UDP-xylose and UDP-N-acetylglucosamine transporter [Anthonomus grandis grandis]XP_050313308.1 UDP-xylose and UDP-N-acetylglucosamine transporter [Anthonomus grandis grandis]XP_050313309.1 UDP-xylose and UDP-N-acetylglucosamine transporter [Anthonomus grandis grandis]